MNNLLTIGTQIPCIFIIWIFVFGKNNCPIIQDIKEAYFNFYMMLDWVLLTVFYPRKLFI